MRVVTPANGQLHIRRVSHDEYKRVPAQARFVRDIETLEREYFIADEIVEHLRLETLKKHGRQAEA